jgi:uncharacterized protein (DUF1684 family)
MGKILNSVLVVSCSLFVAGAGFSSCTPGDRPTEQQISDHRKDVETWYNDRVDDLKSHDGWLNLAGLFWLNEGMNSFGSDEGNDVVFPAGKIAGKAGYFMVKGNKVTLIPSKDADITVYGQPIDKDLIVFHPDSVKAVKQLQGSVTRHGSLEWFIIRRDDKMGIRLRDLESEAVRNFAGIERYPVDYSWKIKAVFEPATPAATINITNVLGQTTAQELTGIYVFQLDGKEHRLSATGNGKKLLLSSPMPPTGRKRILQASSFTSTGPILQV